MSKRTVAARPRQQDKRDTPQPEPRTPITTMVRRYRPPAAQWGLWELPDRMGITVLRQGEGGDLAGDLGQAGSLWAGGAPLGTEAQSHRGGHREGFGGAEAGFHNGGAEDRRSDGGRSGGTGSGLVVRGVKMACRRTSWPDPLLCLNVRDDRGRTCQGPTRPQTSLARSVRLPGPLPPPSDLRSSAPPC